MPENIRIAITHKDGSRYFTICPTRKKILLSIAGALSLAVLVAFVSIYFLSHRSSEAEMAAEQLRVETQQLEDELAILKDKRDSLEQVIETKDVELTSLTQRVVTVEDMLGLASVAAESSLQERLDVAAINTAVRATMLRLIPSGKPIESYRRSSGYGSRKHPVTGKAKFHLGLDLTADVGTPVYAPADGVVEYTRASRKQGYGNLIKVDHAFGFMTLYAHLQKFNVKSGQFVKKGDLIAWSGNSGLSTGPHLHYEVRFLGRALNPRRFIDWTPDNFESLFEEEKKVGWASLVKIVESMVETQVQVASIPAPPAPIKTAQNVESTDEQSSM